jgi:hypothetical protein
MTQIYNVNLLWEYLGRYYPNDKYERLKKFNEMIGDNKVSKEILKEINDLGGEQSLIETRCDLLPALALKKVGVVMREGAKRYKPNNWRLIDTNSHLNHALEHTFNFFDDINSYDKIEELSHAATRLLMALETYIPKPNVKVYDKEYNCMPGSLIPINENDL